MKIQIFFVFKNIITIVNDFVTRDIILKELGFEYFHESFTNETNKNAHFGLATFSKYPIIGKNNIEFNNDQSNHCIWSDIIFKTDTLRIFNSHLGSIRFNHSDYNIIGGKESALGSSKILQDIINRLKIGFIKKSQQLKELLPIIDKSPSIKLFVVI